MKLYAFIITCTVIAGCSGNSFAAFVGSPRPVAQENFQQLIKTNECPYCDLAGVVFTRVDLSEANLEGANLAGAKLYLANLSNANLKNANLQGAELGGADLADADLRGANLTGAVLEGAYLKGAKIDGQIIDHKPYEAEELSGVSEIKHVAKESRGKNVPYTQDVVIADSRDFGESASVEAVSPQEQQQKEATVATDMAAGSTAMHAKKMIPMADAVVHTPDPKKTADVEKVPEPVAATAESVAEVEGDTGLWGTVTSFFAGNLSAVKSEPEDVASIDQESAVEGVNQAVDEVVAKPTQEMVVRDEALAESGQEGVVNESTVVEPAGKELVQEIVSGEKKDNTGLWGSVTSIFSSGGDKEKDLKQESVEKAAEGVTILSDEEVAVATAQTDRDELKTNDPIIAEYENISVAETATVIEAPGQGAARERKENGAKGRPPAAASTVGGMISQVEADQVPEAESADSIVYGVETPEQARAKQQVNIDKLLDEDRCVDCDLAGVDLSGKNLDEVDLERANLQGAKLEGVELREANLKGVDFSGANLKNADLRGADLYLADFTGADLAGADLEGALIDSANFTDATGVNLDTALKDE